LVSRAGLELSFWDGDDPANFEDGKINGGDGTWRADKYNWTTEDGKSNGAMQPVPIFAIFAGSAGTVTVDDSAGAIEVAGMQFATDGYVIDGDSIGLALEGDNIVRVGDGSGA